MKNQLFEIGFDPENGTVSSVIHPGDPHRMNWCSEAGGWGAVAYTHWQNGFKPHALRFVSFSETEERAVSVYENPSVCVTAERFFDGDGRFTERYTVKNRRTAELFLNRGELDIAVPLNDTYTCADECMVHHCHAHLWCAHNTAYINALRMGPSEINLGLVLTRGALDSYSVEGTKTNRRGTFLLDCAHTVLPPDGEYVLEWKLFWHTGNGDFYRQAAKFPRFIGIRAEHFTVFEDETVSFRASLPQGVREAEVFCDDERVPCRQEAGEVLVEYVPRRLGEHRFCIRAGGAETWAEFFVAENFHTLLKKRIGFIVDRQQYRCPGSALDGAFLIYDNREKHMVFDTEITDHNACRERVGMALLIARYLQIHPDDRLRAALDRYIAFAKREFYDEETGNVYDSIGKRGNIRLYNAPWIVMLFTELYRLDGDPAWLRNILKMLKHYYENGGSRFYPNGFSIYKTAEAFRTAGMQAEYRQVLAYFTAHADNMVSNGLSYPKHEVNYEQTIVTPAVTILSEAALLTKDDRYAAEAQKHIAALERFNGCQPSHHLNEIPIRYWDDYWFGRRRLFGDVFPHYWSCLTARAYMDYFRVSGEKKYRSAAAECIRNCLCLFNGRGEGSCACVYPFRVNGQPGRFYDEWANDQDFALYFALDLGIPENG